MRHLPCRHIFRRLLEFDHLFVRERDKQSWVSTTLWVVWQHAHTLTRSISTRRAHLALEEGPMHLWNQLGHPDPHHVDGDELTDVFWIRVSHILHLQYTEWSYRI